MGHTLELQWRSSRTTEKFGFGLPPSDLSRGYPGDCWDDFSVLDVKVTDFGSSQKYHKSISVEKIGETSDFFDELLYHIFRDEIFKAVMKFPQLLLDVSLSDQGEGAFLALRFDLRKFKPIPSGGNPDHFKLHFRLYRKKDRAVQPLNRLEAMAAAHTFQGEIIIPLDKITREEEHEQKKTAIEENPTTTARTRTDAGAATTSSSSRDTRGGREEEKKSPKERKGGRGGRGGRRGKKEREKMRKRKGEKTEKKSRRMCSFLLS